ncbi:MAG TPA: right-handed parallel beta-helix repeat-containing protein [Verrucomicrobiae bacterium]|nr:right-handed parallel beta-helix repeat-containing protein [Verrucomicrobiae bacterium]
MIRHWAYSMGFLVLTALAARAQTGVLTLNIGAPAVPPSNLVKHDDEWRYHLGTNAPQANWKTVLDDGELDPVMWGYGPGGFGYEDGDDNTLLLVMSNRCSTLYIRRNFDIPAGVDPIRNLRLTMDWDDGFIAWIDGVEVARSANAPPGEPPNTALSNPPNHEASRGAGGSPPTTYELGPVGARLTSGAHVLAIMGLNGALNSSDFSLIADLVLAGTSGGADADGYFALVHTNSITLSGSNTLANAAQLTINGLTANYDAVTRTWSRVQSLQPGMNRLFIASLDAQGHILGSISKDIVSELISPRIGGSISSNTTWSGTIRVTNELLITSGARLTINPGTVVLLTPNGAVRAATNSTVEVSGSEDQPVFLLPVDANTPWREIGCIGPASSLRLTFAEIVAAQMRVQNGGSGLMQLSILRDLPTALEVVEADNGAQLTLLQSYFARFSELDSQNTPVWIEGCLFEHFAVDGIDIKTTLGLPLNVRWSTFRYADPNNLNADAVDFGPGAGTVERCLIHGFPDKGVSIGGAPGTIVRDSLIYNCGIGVSAYSSTNVLVERTTIAACTNGILFRDNPQPAIGSASNIIVWGNRTNVAVLNSSSLTVSQSDIQGGYPGPGNISSDPLLSSDYRLASNSPAQGMGARFPLGGMPSTPFNLAVVVSGSGPLTLTWEEDADNEDRFVIEQSVNGSEWYILDTVGPNQTTYTNTSAGFEILYFYRVRAESGATFSRWSNLASGMRQKAIRFVGGTLTENTIWSPEAERFVVASNLIVPTNITLTILAGADVRLTNNASIRATAGGVINVAGAEWAPVRFTRANTNNNWGEIAADGNNSFLTLRYAEIEGGTVKFRNGAAGVMEDCYVHHFQNAGSSIAGSTSAREVRVRRCHFAYYHETLWQYGVMTIEDSLFEHANNPSSDALDFDGALPGSVIRRCTFRHGPAGNTDAIDLGSGSTGTLVEDCLMYDFPNDKGISIGESSFGIVIRNCLMYGCDSGVAVKDNCTATIYQCTIVQNDFGYKNFNKANPSSPTGGGHIIDGWDNILWNNVTNVSLLNGSTMTNDHSDLGTNWPGAGNINVDPLFLNAAARDYRLAQNSPCRGTGRNGAEMGAHFPVGAPMASSHPEFVSINAGPTGMGYGTLLRFWADSERTYTVYYGPTVNGPWTELEHVPASARPTLAWVFDPFPAYINPENRFYRLTSP